LNWSLCQKLKTDQQSIESILAFLQRNGASAHCHIISESKRLDGIEMRLSDALQEVVGAGIGSVILSADGRLAYYEGEGKNVRYFCREPSVKAALVVS